VPPEIVAGVPSLLSVEGVGAGSSGSSSRLLPLALVIALGLALLMVAIALTPPWVLPRTVGVAVYDRRDSFVYAGIATALSIGLGLLITVALS
jgi:hypothetical protein